MNTYAIGSSELTYDLIEQLLKDKTKLVLSDEAVAKIQHCRDYLDSKMEDTSKCLPSSTFLVTSCGVEM